MPPTRPGRVAALDIESGEPHWSGVVEPFEPESEQDYRQCNPPKATERGLVVPSRRPVTLLDPVLELEAPWRFEA